MSRTDKIISNFLRELHSKEVGNLFEHLDVLMDHLETKDDPDPSELQIVNSVYEVLEHLRTLEAYLKRRVGDSPQLTGSKLQSLYDKAPIHIGTQAMFND